MILNAQSDGRLFDDVNDLARHGVADYSAHPLTRLVVLLAATPARPLVTSEPAERKTPASSR